MPTKCEQNAIYLCAKLTHINEESHCEEIGHDFYHKFGQNILGCYMHPTSTISMGLNIDRLCIICTLQFIYCSNL